MRQLPERPATHFDMQGRPDGWMDRSSHLVFMLLFGLGTPAFVITLCWALRFLPPSLLNVPKPEYWRSPEHYPEACRILLRWSVWLAVFMLVLMTFINREVVAANLKSPPMLSTGGLLLLVFAFSGGVLASIAWLVWRFSKTSGSGQDGGAR